MKILNFKQKIKNNNKLLRIIFWLVVVFEEKKTLFISQKLNKSASADYDRDDQSLPGHSFIRSL